jgi:16S rRNA processing protein RimM
MVVLGRIIAPFGVQGWLKIQPLGDDPAAWRSMPRLWLGDPDRDIWQSFELTSLKLHGKVVVAKLAGIDDRTAAESIDGQFVGAPRDALPQTGDDEYYWADLIGLRVVNAQGIELGKVAELIETGANDVLVVRAEGENGGDRLLPFIAQVVQDVDVAGGVVRVDWQQDW